MTHTQAALVIIFLDAGGIVSPMLLSFERSVPIYTFVVFKKFHSPWNAIFLPSPAQPIDNTHTKMMVPTEFAMPYRSSPFRTPCQNNWGFRGL